VLKAPILMEELHEKNYFSAFGSCDDALFRVMRGHWQ
jgi:hypothetical protein